MYSTRKGAVRVTVILAISLLVIIFPIIRNYRLRYGNTISKLPHNSDVSDGKSRNKDSFSIMKNPTKDSTSIVKKLNKNTLPIMKSLRENSLPIMKSLSVDSVSKLDDLDAGSSSFIISTSSFAPEGSTDADSVSGIQTDPDSVSMIQADPDSGSTDCVRVHLSQTKLPLTYLASFPGSGNTWVRHLLQQASGKLREMYATLKALNYFYINHGTQRVFSI